MSDDTLTSNPSIDALNKAFLLNFPKDAARKMETMLPEDVVAIISELPAYIIAPVWSHLAPGFSEQVFERLPKEAVHSLLTTLDAGAAATLISRFDSDTQSRFLNILDDTTASELKELLSYPDNTAGKLMDTHVIAFNESITVGDALKQLKEQNIETIHHIFLLNDDKHLIGQVDIRRLVLADAKLHLSKFSKPIRAYATILDSKDEVIDKLKQYKKTTLAVVDGNNHLVGIIYESNLIQDLKEDIAADLQTMVGVSKDEHALSSAWFAVKKRQPWLQINLITAFLAAAVVGLFEDTIARYTALAILLPIAAGQSGNTGAQALAVTMRGLTLREITVRHWFRIMKKEAGAAIINGLAIAATCGTGVYIWSQSVGLALVISLAMVSSMTIAAIGGALVPIVLKRLGQDPALSSSIILTTITDIAGFMSFLGIATALSGML